MLFTQLLLTKDFLLHEKIIAHVEELNPWLTATTAYSQESQDHYCFIYKLNVHQVSSFFFLSRSHLRETPLPSILTLHTSTAIKGPGSEFWVYLSGIPALEAKIKKWGEAQLMDALQSLRKGSHRCWSRHGTNIRLFLVFFLGLVILETLAFALPHICF